MAIVSGVNDAFVRVLNAANQKLRKGGRHAVAIVGRDDEFRVSLYFVGPDYRRVSEMKSVKTSRRGIKDVVERFASESNGSHIPAFLLGPSGREDYRRAWTLVDPATLDVKVVDDDRVEAIFNH